MNVSDLGWVIVWAAQNPMPIITVWFALTSILFMLGIYVLVRD